MSSVALLYSTQYIETLSRSRSDSVLTLLKLTSDLVNKLESLDATCSCRHSDCNIQARHLMGTLSERALISIG